MGRLLTRTMLLALVLSLFVSVSKIVGNRTPPPSSIRQLHLTNCELPCWAGIQLGQESTQSAVELIHAALPNYTILESGSKSGLQRYYTNGNVLTDFETFVQDDSHHRLNIIFSYESGTTIIQEVGFVAVGRANLPTIRELSATFGAPVCVIQNPGRSNTPLTAVFQPPTALQGFQITARIMNRGNGWNAPVYEVRLSSMPPQRCDEWKGFTNLAKHLPQSR